MSFFLRHKRYDTQIADAFYIDIVSFTSRSLIHLESLINVESNSAFRMTIENRHRIAGWEYFLCWAAGVRRKFRSRLRYTKDDTAAFIIPLI